MAVLGGIYSADASPFGPPDGVAFVETSAEPSGFIHPHTLPTKKAPINGTFSLVGAAGFCFGFQPSQTWKNFVIQNRRLSIRLFSAVEPPFSGGSCPLISDEL